MSTAERIEFRGRRVTPDWPDRLAVAQLEQSVLINGVAYARLTYGEETEDWGAAMRPCHDCVAVKGELHVLGCDVEQCPRCGEQLITCECDVADGSA